MCALAVCAAALFYLQPVLVRFVLALALKYLLTPLIQFLSQPIDWQVRSMWLPHQLRVPFKMPHALAILIALILAAGSMGLLGVVVGRSIVAFAVSGDSYRERVRATRAPLCCSRVALHCSASDLYLRRLLH